MSKYPTIPDFLASVESMFPAVRALKASMEQITGQRQGQSLGAPDMFLQEGAPASARPENLKAGDLWIKPSTRKMSYWDGREWVELL